MAKLETQHVFNGSQSEVFHALSQYEKYPDYIQGVTGISVLPAKVAGSVCQVRYELRIIKEFYYVLNMFQTEPLRIWWDLAESNIMKANSGAWELESADKSSTKATYTLDVRFKGLIPRAVTDKIAETNLPGMLVGFQKLIDDVRQQN